MGSHRLFVVRAGAMEVVLDGWRTLPDLFNSFLTPIEGDWVKPEACANVVGSN